MNNLHALRAAPPLSRRTFLQLCGAAALAAGCAPDSSPAPAAESMPDVPMPDMEVEFMPDVEIVLRAEPATHPILEGAPTQVWRYVGEVRTGDPSVLQLVADSYLGPTLRLRQGQKVRVELQNGLDEPTNIHWHGLIVPEDADGHPRDVAPAGGSYIYEFEVRNRAGTYWYHPHAHGRTAPQVYNGLAGLVIVDDAESDGLALPSGAQDVALVLQDRTFDADNQLVYLTPGSMEQMMGFLGEQVLVNGRADFVLDAATRAYRVRILNGSNSRIYKLGWSDGTPLTVIGVDGGLLEAPVTQASVTLAPAQRVELWVDLRAQAVGGEIKLVSLPFSGVEAGMMHMEPPVPNGTAQELLRVRIARAETETLALPERLASVEYPAAEALAAATLRSFALGMDDAQQWTINSRIFEMESVADDEQAAFGSLEVWEFVNEMDPAGMGMDAPGAGSAAPMDHSGHMQHGAAPTPTPAMDHSKHGGAAMPAETGMVMKDFMAHPMHIHGVQFQVLERQVMDAYRAGWEGVAEGYVDAGWLDTVLVMPGERVRLALRFDGYPGLYVYHCHNLEHEDTTMMRNYRILA